MIEYVFDLSRIKLTDRQFSQMKFKILYELNKNNALAAKESLQRFINDFFDISKHESKQVIIIKPFKTNDKVIFDISRLTDKRLKLIIEKYLKK